MDGRTFEQPVLEEDLGLEIIQRPLVFHDRPGYLQIKRVVELIIVLAGLPFVLPLMAGCAFAIWLDSGRPIFFVQERVGRGGRRFNMIKFRTMVANVDDREHRQYMRKFVTGELGQSRNGVYKPASQSQITRVGRFLRKTSLDELPQLINVWRGDMSLVGPRPNLAWEVEAYQLWHHERLEIRPGITGLAQVHGRSSLPFEKIVQYDVEYVANMSLMLDLKILWLTARVLLKGIGAL
jgi:lipopolysaccharide/colanic/teichoic acid biosynthesis glycosyltransferase